MKKTSIASLQERLAGWTDWDMTMYHVGVCLGFWPEFGAPPGEDQWHGVKHIIWSANPLGDAISDFVSVLVKLGCLHDDPDSGYCWNKDYKGEADLMSML